MTTKNQAAAATAKKVAPTPVPPPAGANHLCFAQKDGEGRWAAVTPAMAAIELAGMDPQEPRPLDVLREYFHSDDGSAVYSAPVWPGGGVGGTEKGVTGGVRSPSQMCCTGTMKVREACRALGVKVPKATVELEARQSAECRSDGADTTEAGDAGQNERTDMAGKKSGKGKGAKKAAKREGPSLTQAWSDLLAANEKRKLTDEQLVAEMVKQFPDKKGKSTITRVSMVRGCYNKGTNMFKSMGKAGVAGRPTSHAYDENGEQRAPRSKGGKKKEKKAAKPKAAKGGGKKKVVRRKPAAAAPAAPVTSAPPEVE